MSINTNLQKIIKSSSFKTIEGNYVYTKVRNYPSTTNHFMISQDKDEITVVTDENNLGELNLVEKNKDTYKLIALNVSIPFYSVGFLATVSKSIADKGLNVLIVSTYSKDYILIEKSCLNKAVESLKKLGLSEK